MWVVFMHADYEGEWGHKYFNQENNAEKYFEKVKELMMFTSVTMRKIITED